MSIVLQGSTSGSITLQEPAVAGTTTIDLPATSGTALVAPTALTVPNTTGTVMVSGNMPAFYAYQSSAQSVTSNVATKLVFNSVVFDTNSNYSTANNRFTPTVAGYYQINALVNPGTTTTNTQIYLYKNGSRITYMQTATSNSSATLSALMQMNGSTDYLEVYVVLTGVTPIVQDGQDFTYFSGSLVRNS